VFFTQTNFTTLTPIDLLFDSFVELLYDCPPPDLAIDLFLLSSFSRVDYTNLYLLLMMMMILLLVMIMMTMMMKIFSML